MNNSPMIANLIAPCGMNCRLCMAYKREKNPCIGCRVKDQPISKSRAACHILNCANIKEGKAKYCFICEKYPCADVIHLDKRYRTRYGMSMIENLDSIKLSGIREFVKQEKERWACSRCGSLLCVHKECCMQCGQKWR